MVWRFWRRFTNQMDHSNAESESLADGLDDMIFFERRLNEVVTGMQPKAMKWIVVLGVVCLITIVSAYYWVMDPSIRYISFYESLWKHPFFSTGFLTLVMFTLCGVQKRIIAPSIIAARCRTVLVDFYLSCDEQGRLIVRPTHNLGQYTYDEEMRGNSRI
ncbi:hypothetical protein M3Y99_01359700 [Aphelenchoides fujianensis]|nr:hypothetical protein M3Y99_01359700 [Aphelenchoides fujianensis]